MYIKLTRAGHKMQTVAVRDLAAYVHVTLHDYK